MIDKRVADWLNENPNDEVQKALDDYNEAWYGFFKAEPQTHTVQQSLKYYAILKRVFHTASKTPYF